MSYRYKFFSVCLNVSHRKRDFLFKIHDMVYQFNTFFRSKRWLNDKTGVYIDRRRRNGCREQNQYNNFITYEEELREEKNRSRWVNTEVYQSNSIKCRINSISWIPITLISGLNYTRLCAIENRTCIPTKTEEEDSLFFRMDKSILHTYTTLKVSNIFLYITFTM